MSSDAAQKARMSSVSPGGQRMGISCISSTLPESVGTSRCTERVRLSGVRDEKLMLAREEGPKLTIHSARTRESCAAFSGGVSRMRQYISGASPCQSGETISMAQRSFSPGAGRSRRQAQREAIGSKSGKSCPFVSSIAAACMSAASLWPVPLAYSVCAG